MITGVDRIEAFAQAEKILDAYKDLERLSLLVDVFDAALLFQLHANATLDEASAVAKRCADALALDSNKYARTVASRIANDIKTLKR